MTKTFEELFAIVQSIILPGSGTERRIEWCDSDKIIGLARDSRGAYEIFIKGPQLVGTMPLVISRLRYDEWSEEGAPNFVANQIVLPQDSHYEPVSAFLVEEFMRAGVCADSAAAFRAVEPILDMALRRTAHSDAVMLGLFGELIVLESFLAAKAPVGRALLLDNWRGHQRSSRDFSLTNAQVEVKSTTRAHSEHEIGSLGQVDPSRNASGDPTENLRLISLGFRVLDIGEPDGDSLPELVDRILNLLGPAAGDRTEQQALLLKKVSLYGGEERGYVHDAMKGEPAYSVKYERTFCRIYDMNDESVRVLRKSDLLNAQHVVSSSVAFTVNLPDQVTGDINPVTSLPAFAASVV